MEKKKCSLYKHGMSDTKLFRIWCDMRKRCRDKNVQHYDRYGGRGIKVCDEWNGEFIPFYEWAMKNGYEDGLSIDRIDVNGDYEPSNCRWIPLKEQKRNTTQTVYLENDGVRKPLIQWCEELGVDYKRAISRHKRGIKDFNRIMFDGCLKIDYKSTRLKRNDLIKITIDGVTKPLTIWCEELGLNKMKARGWKDRHGTDYLKNRLAAIIQFKKDGKPWDYRKWKYYYILEKDGKQYEFQTEQDACKFVGVHQAVVYQAYKAGRTLYGYTIQRLESFPKAE